MKKFKTVESNKYELVMSNALGWYNKYCNNGTASLKGIRSVCGWKDAYIVLCRSIYVSIPYEIYIQL